MYPFSPEFWANLERQIHGPGSFRFIVQPTMAIILGIRDGLNDAKEGKPPYVLGILFHPEMRRALWQSGLKSIAKPVLFAIVLDAIFQYVIIGRIYPGAAIIVGTFLMGIPYILARAVTNRIASRHYRRGASTDAAPGPA